MFFCILMLTMSLSGCFGDSNNKINGDDTETILEQETNSTTELDTDGDGIIDKLDICIGHNDYIDQDGDGVIDLQVLDPKLCVDYIDSDGDGVVDSSDICVDFDDNIDIDYDGIPDGCDELIDTDGDGIGDDFDICPGESDTIDLDGDGIGDFKILKQSDCGYEFDFDSDGVPNSYDLCPGENDNLDVDEDGIPDLCDTDIIIPKLIVITVDVEAKTDAEGAVDLLVYGIDGTERAGVIEMMDIGDEFGVKISFFVDVFEIYLHGEEWRVMMKNIHSRGHDVQLHFHPRLITDSAWSVIENDTEWIESGAVRGYDMNCWNQATADYFWNYAMEVFDELNITRPIAFRGGAYRFCDTSIVAMERTNMTQSYNYNPFSYSQVYSVDRGYMDHFTWSNGVMEFPISYVRWEDGDEIHSSRRIDESLYELGNESYWNMTYAHERYFNHTSNDSEIFQTQVMTMILHSFSFLSHHHDENGTYVYNLENYDKMNSFRNWLYTLSLSEEYKVVSATELQVYIDAGLISQNVELSLELISNEC